MSFFKRNDNDILEEAIKAEKVKLAENKIMFEEKKNEFHKVKPLAGDILGGYVEVILRQRGKKL